VTQITMQMACQRCRRLIAADCLPERAGQPTQIQLLMSLDQLRGLPGGGAAEAAWAGSWTAPGNECDATIVPMVIGHVDTRVLDQLADLLARLNAAGWHNQHWRASQAEQHERAREADAARRELVDRALRQILISSAADLLSGPTGLAAYLRTGLLNGPAASMSLPLDVGAATETIPAHLRRLVIARHCRFPGCSQPPAACQPHHILPRSKGGKTCLTNLLLLCTFHHLIAVHRWGWGILLLPDGSVTATSPDGDRILRSPRAAFPGRLSVAGGLAGQGRSRVLSLVWCGSPGGSSIPKLRIRRGRMRISAASAPLPSS
jgi:hypothetical protein